MAEVVGAFSVGVLGLLASGALLHLAASFLTAGAHGGTDTSNRDS